MEICMYARVYGSEGLIAYCCACNLRAATCTATRYGPLPPKHAHTHTFPFCVPSLCKVQAWELDSIDWFRLLKSCVHDLSENSNG